MSTMDFTVRPATSAQWLALEDLFGRPGASNGCWCMYWRIGPRYRDRPRADNKEDLRRLAASGRPPGLLGFQVVARRKPDRPVMRKLLGPA